MQDGSNGLCQSVGGWETRQVPGVEDRVRNRDDGQCKECDPDHRAVQRQRGCTEHDGERQVERAMPDGRSGDTASLSLVQLPSHDPIGRRPTRKPVPQARCVAASTRGSRSRAAGLTPAGAAIAPPTMSAT